MEEVGERGLTGVILLGSGESSRMGGNDKIFAPILNQPLITYSLSVINESPHVGSIVLVLSKNGLENGRQLMRSKRWDKLINICEGGDRRQDSVKRGLECLPPCEWVMVHDGARPLLDLRIIALGVETAYHSNAAVAAVPVKDTIKISKENLVVQTLDREHLWSVQTPQIFRRELLEEAHQKVEQDVTDDAGMLELIGHPVKIFLGSYENLKVTTSIDLDVVETVFSRRRDDRQQELS